LVEHIIRNDGVTCSSHVSGTTSFTSDSTFIFIFRSINPATSEI
jgi:hypothetical protein